MTGSVPSGAGEQAQVDEHTYCAYCNAAYDLDSDIAQIQAHIYECPEHPLPPAIARAEAAETALRERDEASAWAAEPCWYVYNDMLEHIGYPRAKCDQRRDHVVHDGFCVGCDSDVPHNHHLFMPKESSDEYWAAKHAAERAASEGETDD